MPGPWHAMPPELTAALLMAGAGPAPMLASAAGWTGLAASLEAQSADLAQRLQGLGQSWTGNSSEIALAKILPMVTWLQSSAAMATARAAKATSQATAYTTALLMTPSLVEIAMNHITNAVLNATNFLGINLVPIAFNELEYIAMWLRAALAMDMYDATTTMNTMFEQIEPMTAILDPAVSQLMPTSEMFSSFSSSLSQAGSSVSSVASTVPIDQVLPALSQAAPVLSQLSAPMQQMTSMTSMFGQMTSQMGGSGAGSLADKELPQIGLLGASPLSNHPLAGGIGPTKGLGLLTGDLPGTAGSAARTPLMSSLLEKPLSTSVAPASAGAGAPAATGAGAGASAAGGAAPMSAMQGAQAAGQGAKPVLAPSALGQDDDRNDHEDWDDEEDW